MLELIKGPWPWYVSGILIATIMIILTLFGKKFGVSANLKTICTISGAGKISDFFDNNWRNDSWNLFFLVGSIIGGFITHHFLMNSTIPVISSETILELNKLGFSAPTDFQPQELFSNNTFSNFKNLLLLIVGGLLVGFGTRWAGGCTSGHAISGLSELQISSLVAVIGFFGGGLIMTHFIFPILF